MKRRVDDGCGMGQLVTVGSATVVGNDDWLRRHGGGELRWGLGWRRGWGGETGAANGRLRVMGATRSLGDLLWWVWGLAKVDRRVHGRRGSTYDGTSYFQVFRD